LQKFFFEAANVRHGNAVNSTAGGDEKTEHLLFNGQGNVLILLESFRQALAAGELSLGDFIELVRAELCEGSELAVLRHVEAQRSGNLAHSFDLRVAADAADRNADVDGGTDTGVEEVGFEINLAVGDGNHVGWNVGGDVASLRFNDGQRSQGACSQFVIQFGGAFQQAGVKIKNVARESFSTGRATQKKRNFTVGLRVFRQSS